MRFLLLGALLAALAGPAAGEQPYAGLQHRDVKALSAEQIDDLRAGRGMGMALAAELNGYPGPVHVLELADDLHLSAEQRRTVTALYEAMKAEAVPLGERLIADEAALERLFAERSATAATVEAATAAIGRTHGALRAAHLRYHLATLALLRPHQVARYAELRGYTGGQAEHHHKH
ncbi:MAG: hypothetical protein RIM84_01190 [Alphaproteobacteria bacterium]